MDLSQYVRENLNRILSEIKTLSQNRQIRLVAVSKTKPVELLLHAHQAGQRIFGENKVQEAREKFPFLPSDTHFHLIGPLQKNKAKYCPGLFKTIHSLSGIDLANELNRRCADKGEKIEVLIQMNLSNETTKNGVPDYFEMLEILAFVKEQCLSLKPVGLMTLPDPNFSESQTAKIYSTLREYLFKAASEAGLKDTFRELSMGMSQDYRIAIQEGATYVRIGSSIFGARQYAKA